MIEEILRYECEVPDWQQRLKATPQNPDYHGEGDVLKHTIMVMDALLADQEYQVLAEEDRRILLYAALLHDIAKPFCTREEDGMIVSPNHALKGSMEARRLIYKYQFMESVLGKISFEQREKVCSFIRYHGLPIFFMGRHEVEREIIKTSLEINLHHLSILSRADAMGRKSGNQQEILDNTELFKIACEELECLDKPRAFLNDRSRFYYFKRGEQYLNYKVFDEHTFTVYLMSGIPASGKDTYIKQFLGDCPVISLDEIRREQGISPLENQGRVVQEAKALAKQYLARKTGFVWNATNISQFIRTPLIDLFLDYGADVKVVYCEAPLADLLKRNGKRKEPVFEDAILRMIDKLEVPRGWEATAVEYHVMERC